MQSNESAADDVDGCHGDDDVKYSFSTVHNVDLYGCELAPTVREGMRAWNMTVQYWLATYVYKRLPVKTAALRLCILDLVMAALCNRAGHYIFALWFLSSIYLFFSSPNLSGHRLDVYHTSTHGMALVRI